MLEFAAKAAGLHRCENYYTDAAGNHVEWNPITDDGDALRLAVKLWLTTETCMTYAQAITSEGEIYRVFAEEIDDPLAATRRAIVRAAAGIGKGMK